MCLSTGPTRDGEILSSGTVTSSLRVNGAWNFIIEIPETTRGKRFLSVLAKIAIFVLLRANSLILVGGLATKRRAPLSPSLPLPSLPCPALPCPALPCPALPCCSCSCCSCCCCFAPKNRKSPLNLRFGPGQHAFFDACVHVRTPIH